MLRAVDIVLQNLVYGLILDHLQVINCTVLEDLLTKKCCKSIRLVQQMMEISLIMCLLLKMLFYVFMEMKKKNNRKLNLSNKNRKSIQKCL